MSAFTTADANVVGTAGQASALYPEKKPCAVDDEEDADALKAKRQFVRTYSGASTECFETLPLDSFELHRCFSDGDASLSPASRCHFDEPTIDRVDEHMMRVKSQNDRMEANALLQPGFGHEMMHEASELCTCFRDEDGMVWIRTAGQGVEKQREAYNRRLDALSQSLNEAKVLFRSACGDMDDDESDDECGLDEDDMVWTRINGKGAAEQSETYQGKVAAVQDLCDEVKLLWRAKFGEDPDDSDSDNGAYIDGDNTAWVKTGSEGAEMQKWAYSERVAALDESLDEAKRAYLDKFGERVEEGDAEDYVHDADGTAWLRTEGDGAESQRERYFERLECLETSLAEVKDLFQEVTGQDVEEEEDFVDHDGTLWVRSMGEGVDKQQDGLLWTRTEAVPVAEEKSAYSNRIDLLLEQCSQTKAMIQAESGEDLDQEEEDLIDDDGTLWIRQVGAGFAKQCQAYQQQVSNLESLSKELQAFC